MSFRRPIQVRRIESSGRYINGTYVPGGCPVNVPNVTASIQPATGKDMQSLPEGRRSAESYVLFTDTELFTAESSTSKNPDVVIIGGFEFEVVICKPWQNGVASHYWVVVSKAGQ